jgi:RNase P protein component
MSVKPGISGIKGRRRLLEVLKCRRSGKPAEITLRNDVVEFLLLFSGRWNAVERNRLRRRIRSGMLTLTRDGRLSWPRAPLVMRADRRMLNESWESLLEMIRRHGDR